MAIRAQRECQRHDAVVSEPFSPLLLLHQTGSLDLGKWHTADDQQLLSYVVQFTWQLLFVTERSDKEASFSRCRALIRRVGILRSILSCPRGPHLPSTPTHVIVKLWLAVLQ